MTDFLKSLKGILGMNKTKKTSPSKASQKTSDAKAKKAVASSKSSVKSAKKPMESGKVTASSPKSGKEVSVVMQQVEVSVDVQITSTPPPSVMSGAAVEDASDEETYLTDAEGNRYCRVRDCDQAAIVNAYCRYHYLLLWKRIQVRQKILTDGKLERYVEELTSRYPDKFLEMIRRDLKTEKDFLGAIQELEIDESGLEAEFEDDQSYMDEVRGMGESAGAVEEDGF